MLRDVAAVGFATETSTMIKVLENEKFGFVCANCEHLWWSFARGIHRGGCRVVHASLGACGGPLSNLAYPRYEGPLKSVLAKFCFRCGKESELVVIVPGGKVGVCEEHTDILRTFSLPGTPPPVVLKRKIDLASG